MNIILFDIVNGQLVKDEKAFNAETDIAVLAQKARFTFKFKAGCNKYYDKAEPYKILFQPKYINQVLEYIASVNGTVNTQEPNFDRVMREEGLRDLLGNVRLHRIEFTVKRVTNGNNCAACIC